MKRKIKLIIIIILMIGLVGCSKQSNDIKNVDTVTEDNHEVSFMSGTVNINTDAGDFGAGFVYRDNYIITNYHVVYNAKDITVVTYLKEEYSASLVGFDAELDVAVLKIEKGLESVVLGDSDKVKAGDILVAVGNPNGDLSFSTAEGKVLDLEEDFMDTIDRYRKYIWYDGDVVSGYSGGPVYNQKGEVIGILNNKIMSDLSQYDFEYLSGIIPINRVKTIMNKIIDDNAIS